MHIVHVLGNAFFIFTLTVEDFSFLFQSWWLAGAYPICSALSEGLRDNKSVLVYS